MELDGTPYCTHHGNEAAARAAALREADIAHRLSGDWQPPGYRPPGDRPGKRRHSEWVYFIQVIPDGPIKIGKACDPERRIRELQTACPYELVVLAVTKRCTETELHSRFAHLRIRGEWFEPHPDVLHLAQRFLEAAA